MRKIIEKAVPKFFRVNGFKKIIEHSMKILFLYFVELGMIFQLFFNKDFLS